MTPNGHYMGRTAQLTSRCCILYIYSTNILPEYFKHAAQSPIFFSSKCRLFHNATFFGSCIIHILNTGVLKFKRKFRRQSVNIESEARKRGLGINENKTKYMEVTRAASNSDHLCCGKYEFEHVKRIYLPRITIESNQFHQ